MAAKERSSTPEEASQRRTVLSELALASRSPSGLKATLLTDLSWPRKE